MRLVPPTPDELARARERLSGRVAATPLVPLRGGAPEEVWCKLENLQPIGSFKLRGAGNALLDLSRAELAGGVVTASAGNMAQGVAWFARQLDVPCRVVVPDSAPRAKLDAVERLGGVLYPVPFARWWQVLEERRCDEAPGTFVHPVADPRVVAGNATIGLELLDQLPDLDAVLVPFGGGGLIAGVASALRAAGSAARVIAVEVETATPLTAALAAGRPVEVEHRPSFVDGIGGRRVLDEMWPLLSTLVGETIVVSLAEVAAAIAHLATANKVVAEGAGAAPVAAALRGVPDARRVACVVSGGNLDARTLACALRGEVP